MIVMTGATGFVGAHLMAELLRAGDESVTLLVAHDPATTVDRLTAAVAGTGAQVPREEIAARVRPVLVRLQAPALGLEPAMFRAIAEEADQIWHCAAYTDAFGDRGRLDEVNVTGTTRVLELAAHARPRTAVCHMSTAFVAGGRRGGVVREDELSGAAEFMTPYEESKYRAERLVHDWSSRHGRAVTVFRPSLLVTDRPWQEGTAAHWQAVLAKRVEMLTRLGPQIMRSVGFTRPDSTAFTLVLPGEPGARANVLQAAWAARAMWIAAACPHPAQAVRTLHVTHPDEISVQELAQAAVCDVDWLDVRIGTEAGDGEAMAPDEFLATFLAYLAPHLHTTRCYDGSGLRQAIGPLAPPAPVTADYLRRGMGRPVANGLSRRRPVGR
ncbi:SDR family oxidoreductase [Streptomyces sp. NPDC016845]|uniref:SDR family oxidoreductase n=1 Tax=Streptomyces sp. NPDC016845 TaxID=3364972 RepID=UPI003799BCBD